MGEDMRDIGDVAEVPEDQRLDYDEPEPNDDADQDDFDVEEGEVVELGGAA